MQLGIRNGLKDPAAVFSIDKQAKSQVSDGRMILAVSARESEAGKRPVG
jgi:hypothetical protein